MSIYEYKNYLKEKGYSYRIIGDYSVEVQFIDNSIQVHETLSEKLLVQLYDKQGNKIKSNSYKTLRGVINFMRNI
jgi:hypothetical protein